MKRRGGRSKKKKMRKEGETLIKAMVVTCESSLTNHT